MLLSLPIVVSTILIIYFLAMWIYTRTNTYIQRLMFFVVGSIVLATIYSIIISNYLNKAFMVDHIGYMQDQLGWEITAIWGITLILLVAGAVILSLIQVQIIRAIIKSGTIGKKLLESNKIQRKINRYLQNKQKGIIPPQKNKIPKSKLDKEFQDAVKYACANYMFSIIEQGADYQKFSDKSLLSIGYWYQAWQTAAMLIKLGANVDACDTDGKTPLMNAASLGNPELVQVLLAAGAAPDTKDKKGRHALIYFVNGSGSGKIKSSTFEILSMVCDIDVQDEEGKTALMYAIDKNDGTMVNDLLKKGASVIKQRNALKWATKQGADEYILKKLNKAIKN